MYLFNLIYRAVIYIFPAYIANSTALIFGGGKPIDKGKKFKGKRILGDGKTYRGLFMGFIFGSLSGWGLSIALSDPIILKLGIALSLGALLGDIFASFLKRRFNKKRGSSVPLLDQLDFVVGAVLAGSIVKTPSLHVFLLIIIITPILHLFTNFLAYLVGLKKEPW